MKHILFSERILFVDGPTDKIIVEALFDVVINDNITELSIGNLSHPVNIDESFRNFLSSIHVSGLGEGKDAADSKTNFCKIIGKDTYRLADLDKITKNANKTVRTILEKLHKKDHRYEVGYLKSSSFKNDSDAVSIFTEEFMRENLFIWTEGAIEKVINTVANKLDAETKKRMEIPITRFHEWKHDLVNKEDEDIKTVAKHIINCDEGARFLHFLHQMYSMSETGPKGRNGD